MAGSRLPADQVDTDTGCSQRLITDQLLTAWSMLIVRVGRLLAANTSTGVVTVVEMQRWDIGQPGVLALPSGRLVRGRALRDGMPAGALPEFGLYLQGKSPPATPWNARWVRWPDFLLPVDRDDAGAAFVEGWHRAADERVEVACSGGHGRTGTALACMAILDGLPSGKAVDFVRAHYSSKAVETPWQRRYVSRFRR